MRSNLLKLIIKKIVKKIHKRPQYIRHVMDRSFDEFISNLPIHSMSAVEISGDLGKKYKFGSYKQLNYPEFDIVKDTSAIKYDFIILNQVLEHVSDPYAALENLYDMGSEDAIYYISVPFLVKIHSVPYDFWRFTPDGLNLLLKKTGFSHIDIHYWGNKSVLKQNLNIWMPFTFLHKNRYMLRNSKEFPVVIWAFCKK
jgi:hypothetical protein